MTIIIFQISNIYFQSFKLFCHHEWRRGSSSFLLYKFAQKCLFFSFATIHKMKCESYSVVFVYVMKRAVYNISYGWNQRERERWRENTKITQKRSQENKLGEVKTCPKILISFSCHVMFHLGTKSLCLLLVLLRSMLFSLFTK